MSSASLEASAGEGTRARPAYDQKGGGHGCLEASTCRQFDLEGSDAIRRAYEARHQGLCCVLPGDDELSSPHMKTYRVTLKVTDASGEPIVREVKGNSYAFSAEEHFTIFANPGEDVAIFPAGEYAAVEISEDPK
jgi:hypothetical protein